MHPSDHFLPRISNSAFLDFDFYFNCERTNEIFLRPPLPDAVSVRETRAAVGIAKCGGLTREILTDVTVYGS